MNGLLIQNTILLGMGTAVLASCVALSLFVVSLCVSERASRWIPALAGINLLLPQFLVVAVWLEWFGPAGVGGVTALLVGGNGKRSPELPRAACPRVPELRPNPYGPGTDGQSLLLLALLFGRRLGVLGLGRRVGLLRRLARVQCLRLLSRLLRRLGRRGSALGGLVWHFAHLLDPGGYCCNAVLNHDSVLRGESPW